MERYLQVEAVPMDQWVQVAWTYLDPNIGQTWQGNPACLEVKKEANHVCNIGTLRFMH